MTVSTDSISTTNSCKSPESIRASSYGTLTSARPSVSSPTRTKMFNTLPITNESVSEVDTDNAKTAKILLDLNSSPEFSSTRVLAGSRSTVGNSMLTIQDGADFFHHRQASSTSVASLSTQSHKSNDRILDDPSNSYITSNQDQSLDPKFLSDLHISMKRTQNFGTITTPNRLDTNPLQAFIATIAEKPEKLDLISIKSPLNGNLINWLEAFFQFVHPQFPLMLPRWTLEHSQIIPKYLNHILYALLLAKLSQMEEPNSFNQTADLHMKYGMIIMTTDEDISMFLNIAGYYKSIYFSYFCRSYFKASTILASIIRATQYMNFNYITWTLSNGKSVELDESFRNVLEYEISLSLYESDFYLSIITKMPFILNETIRTPPLDYRNIVNPNSKFQEFSTYCRSNHFNIEIFYFDLLRLGRRVVSFRRHSSSRGDVNWKYGEKLIHQDLLSWYNMIPFYMKIPTSEYSNDYDSISPPSWFVGYLNCLYHGLIILLFQKSFLEAIEENNDSTIVRQCHQSAITINTILKSFQTNNPTYSKVPAFIGYLAVLATAVKSILCRIYGVEEDRETAFQIYFQVIEYFKSDLSHLDTPRLCLQEWLKDPIQCTIAFKDLM
ncbi:hypothetical protein HDV02_002265 [Globomyces sp. JEL0801]|nr:hypothetical protein HDV02_002265 [Globomyces sp. JEL0801]